MDFNNQRAGGLPAGPFGPKSNRSFVTVTSYQRSCSGSSPSSPDSFTTQIDIHPLQMQMPPPLQLPPLPMPLPMGQPFGRQWPPMSPFGFKGMGQSQDNSSGYASCSSSSSLFNPLRKAPSEHSVFFNSEQLPTPASPTPSSAPSTLNKPKSKVSKATFMKESLIRALDQVDSRVAFLRETANELEEEKRKLLEALINVENTNELALIAEVDREEIVMNSQRLVRMLNTVQVQVSTTRNKEQQLALEAVNAFIANLARMSEGVQTRERARELCRLYLNTCSSEAQCLPVDEKFQRAVIECTVDDQKRVKKRLESQFTSLSSCPPRPCNS